jgi:chromosome segregation ATPase
LEAARDHAPDVERKSAQLDREQRDIEELSTRLLLVQPQPHDIRTEILRLRDRTLAIQNERSDLRTQHARSLSEIHHLEQQITGIEKKIAEFDHSLRELRAGFEKEDGKLAEDERAQAEEKEKVEEQANALEHAKGNPYRAIGAVLADNHIAPMNQPAALAKVLNFRGKIAARESEIDALFRESRSINRTELRISIALWLLVLIAGSLIIGVLL